jgi:hypothetical protein
MFDGMMMSEFAKMNLGMLSYLQKIVLEVGSILSCTCV